MALQETKLQNGSMIQVSNIWGNRVVDFDWVNSEGRSGGLLFCWDPGFFSKTDVMRHRYFIVVSGVLQQNGEVINFGNIYAPQPVVQKRELWNALSDVINFEGWYVGFDG